MTDSRKIIIGYRKTCKPRGTGLSHYIMIGTVQAQEKGESDRSNEK